MKKLRLFVMAGILILSLCACGENLNGTYAENVEKYIIINGEQAKFYKDAKLDKSGTFRLKDSIVTFSFKDEDLEYLFIDNMLCLNQPIKNGYIPEGERFSTICEGASGGYKVTFKEDGTVNKYISLLNINTASFDGFYKRTGNVITADWSGGETTRFLVYNGKLYDDVYVKEE